MPIEQMIYTDRERGKGKDPNLKGYQVKACSPGLDSKELESLGAIAMHFRQSVYENAPKTAHDREQAWRIKTETLDLVPEEVLNEFPHVWSYIQLAEERFAFTRVRYLGFTHDQRPGNFFAHALVFSPDVLSAQNANPMALTRTRLFLSSDPSDRTELSALTDLGGFNGKVDLSPLRDKTCSTYLAAMVHAIGAAPAAKKPVLICLDDWRKSAPLVEALLYLLPPAARCRTTFCTLENDRKWPGPKGAGSPGSSQSYAHHVIVICSPDGRSPEVWPNEYEQTFTVFNFVAGKTSPLVESCKYAQFAAKCAESDNGMVSLSQHHDLVRLLDCGLDREAWDALVSAVGLPTLRSQQFLDAARSLVSVAKKTEQAQAAIGCLFPAVEALAESGDAESLNSAAVELAHLFDRIPDNDEFINKVGGVAEKSYSSGQGRITIGLLRSCGKHRERLLESLLKTKIAAVSPNDQDRSAIVDILLDGMRLTPPTPAYLTGLLDAAQSAGRMPEVWKNAGENAVKTILSSDAPADEKVKFLRDILARVSADALPDANVWLRLQLLGISKPAGEELITEMEELVRAAAEYSDESKLVEIIVKSVEGFNPQEQPVIFGRLADAGRKSSCGNRLFGLYQEKLKELPKKQAREVRRRLVAKGAAFTLCRDFFEDVRSREEEEVGNRVESWKNQIFAGNEKILDEVRMQVGRSLGEEQAMLPLASELLTPRATGDGYLCLFEAVVRSLPMAAIAKDWSKKLLPPPENLPPDAKARLQVFEFLKKLANQSQEDNWSIEKFASMNLPMKEARRLNPGEKAKLLDLCIESIAETGITAPSHAKLFLDIVELSGDRSPEAVAGALGRLLRGRDEVTRVLTAVIFAHHALEGNKQEDWAEIVGAIAGKFDRGTRQLLESHLERRFCRRTSKYDDRLRQLCEGAGLAAPKKASAASPAKQEGAGASKIVESVKGTIGRALGSLFGDSGSGEKKEKK